MAKKEEVKVESASTIEDKDEAIYKLFKLLDDIDTVDDIAQNNYVYYRDAVRAIHRRRFDILNKEQIDVLYAKYYKGAQ